MISVACFPVEIDRPVVLNEVMMRVSEEDLRTLLAIGGLILIKIRL